MRITMVGQSLRGGGAENVFSQLACQLAERHEVAAVLFEKEGVYLPRLEQAGVPVREVRKQRSRLAFIARVRRALVATSPEVVLSFGDTANLVSATALLGLPTPLVVSVRADYRLYSQRGWPRLKLELMRWPYRRSARVVAVSRGLSRHLAQDFGLGEDKLSVIHNGLDLRRLEAKAAEQLAPEEAALFEGPVVLAVGRLTAQKDYPTLLNAFARLELARVQLVVLGVGDARESLLQQAQALGVADRVHLLGYRPNAPAFMRNAQSFVLSSAFEGYPNALAEALLLNGCCVSTDCPTGPAEMIEHGVNGLLTPVGDARALAEALSRLLTDEALRVRLQQEARRRAAKRTVDRMVQEYEQVLREAFASR